MQEIRRHFVHFPTQRPNERVVLLLRSHWTVITRYVLQLAFFLVLPPIALYALLTYTTYTFEPGTLGFVLTIQIVSLYYLFSFLAYFHDFVDYHLDIWVVTDQRIVSIEQQGLFKRVISEVSIFRIQDVTSEVTGKIRTILDFGDVYIQTAGQQERFDFERIAHPAEVARLILQAHERAMKERDRMQMLEELEVEKEYQQGERVGSGAAAVLHENQAIGPRLFTRPQSFNHTEQPFIPNGPDLSTNIRQRDEQELEGL